MAKEKKMVLQKEFERLYDKVEDLFKPVYDQPEEKFEEAIANLQKKGVSIIDVNNVTKRAFAQPNNYSDNPEMRVLIVGGDGKGLKYYRLDHARDADMDLSDGEQKLTEEEFEKLCIPTYTQPNPLMTKEDTKEDYEPKQEEVEGSKAGPDKKMSVKKDEKPLGLSPDHPEVKKTTVEYGDTSSPKNKIKDDAGKVNESFTSKMKKAIDECSQCNCMSEKKTEDLSGGYKGYQIKKHADENAYYIEDAGGTPVRGPMGGSACHIPYQSIAKAWVDALVDAGESAHDYLNKKDDVIDQEEEWGGKVHDQPEDFRVDEEGRSKCGKTAYRTQADAEKAAKKSGGNVKFHPGVKGWKKTDPLYVQDAWSVDYNKKKKE